MKKTAKLPSNSTKRIHCRSEAKNIAERSKLNKIFFVLQKDEATLPTLIKESVQNLSKIEKQIEDHDPK